MCEIACKFQDSIDKGQSGSAHIVNLLQYTLENLEMLKMEVLPINQSAYTLWRSFSPNRLSGQKISAQNDLLSY